MMQVMKGPTSVPRWGSNTNPKLDVHEWWDSADGSIAVPLPGKAKKNRRIKVPEPDALVLIGVFQIYKLVTACKDSEPYFTEAYSYVGQVLSHAVQAYKSPKVAKFSGFTHQLEILWQASEYGHELLHLSRGADFQEESATVSKYWRAPENTRTTPSDGRISEVLGMFSDVIDAFSQEILRPASSKLAMHDDIHGDDDLPNQAGSELESPTRLLRDGSNKREHGASPSQETSRRKRLKAHHTNDEETPVNQIRRYLGPILFSARNVELMMETWRTSRTTETDTALIRLIHDHLRQCVQEELEVLNREWLEKMLFYLKDIIQSRTVETESQQLDPDWQRLETLTLELIRFLERLLR